MATAPKKARKTLQQHLIDLGVSRQDELLGKVRFEQVLPKTAKCVASGRPSPFAMSVTFETATALGTIRVFPLAPATVREWTDSMWVAGDKSPEATRKAIKALEEQLSRAELAVASARQGEKVRLTRKKNAVKADERREAEAAAAKKRTEESLSEMERWKRANANALKIAQREMTDEVARERALQRRFTRPQADTLRLYFAVPEAAQDRLLTDTVLYVLAARRFDHQGQERYIKTRILEIRNGGLLADETPVCEKCGAAMKLRYGRSGAFWGCSSFPACRWAKDARKQVEEAKTRQAIAEKTGRESAKKDEPWPTT